MEYVFYNVNEEDEVYQRGFDLGVALATLREFPNDTMVTCTVGSPTDLDMEKRLIP